MAWVVVSLLCNRGRHRSHSTARRGRNQRLTATHPYAPPKRGFTGVSPPPEGRRGGSFIASRTSCSKNKKQMDSNIRYRRLPYEWPRCYTPESSQSSSHGGDAVKLSRISFDMNRREFLIQIGAAAGCVVGGILTGCTHLVAPSAGRTRRGVSIVCDPNDPIASAKPAHWAVEQLRQTLTGRGFVVRVCTRFDEASPARFLHCRGRQIFAHDTRYRCCSTFRRRGVGHGARTAGQTRRVAGQRHRQPRPGLRPDRNRRRRGAAGRSVAGAASVHGGPGAPGQRVRSVMRLFASDVEDKAWYNDRGFWRDYLSLLAAQRFNRFNLAFGLGYDAPSNLRDTYFYFAYPFLVAVPGYDVRATNLPDAERDHNLEMLRFISDEAAARGLDFQLGLWTHAYRWIDSPDANHYHRGADATDPGAVLPRRAGAGAEGMPQYHRRDVPHPWRKRRARGQLRFVEDDLRRLRAQRAARRDRHARQGHRPAHDRRGAGDGPAAHDLAEVLGRAHGPALSSGRDPPDRAAEAGKRPAVRSPKARAPAVSCGTATAIC